MKQINENKSWYDPIDNGIKQMSYLITKHLWFQIVVALVLGIAVGLLLSPHGGQLIATDLALSLAQWVKLPGSIFLALIQMVVIPLVMTSIMLGIATAGDPSFLRKIALRIFPYFIVTTSIAVSIGMALVLLLEPGKFIDQGMLSQAGSQVTPAIAAEKNIPDKIASLIPNNMTQAIVDQSMLQLVIYAMIIGVALVTLPRKKAKVILQVLDSIQTIAMKVVSWAMLLAPYAVFGLLCDITIRVGVDAILGMSMYVFSVVLGLVILLCVYLLMVKLLAGQPIKTFLLAIRSVQLLAFSTSSSAAVMPLSLKTAEQDLKVRANVGQFVIPLGATVNMDGTALYQTIAAVFLLQAFSIEIEASGLLLLMLTTIGASIGAPSTPGVGIVVLATILAGMGVPATGIGLILGVDRILDMCRTTINVTGDIAASCIMNKWLPSSIENKAIDYWQS